MSRILDLIFSWLYQNNLILNVDESVVITFGNYKDSVPVNIDIISNGHRLPRNTSTKYLGIIYDSNIKWDVHVKEIIKKTVFSLCLL